MGLLDTFFGNADQTQALGLLGAGLMAGNAPQGFMAAQGLLADAPRRKLQQQLMEAQLAETLAQADQRKTQTAREQAELERQARIRSELPGLFKAPGMTGGEPAPQSMGGVPMFSQPMGVTPMRQTPGGFDVQRAISLGLDPKTIQEYAGLQNIGRPKATRQMEVDDGKGGKRIALVDDFGREVAGFAGYTAPVQVDNGRQVSFVKPAPGVNIPKVPTFGDEITMRGQNMTDARARERLAFDQNNTQAGKAPQGYRFKPDGTLEAIPGGPADIKAGELGAKADARSRSAIAQADSVLKEITDAKGMVGWNTAGMGGALSVLPATDARDLSAKLTTIKANLGFDRLQQMRDQSPTGGALGQVAVQELASLQATVASLDQLQSPAQLGTALDKIEKHYTNWRNVVKQAANPQGGATGGWGIQKVN
jgi:hypothetical protein